MSDIQHKARLYLGNYICDKLIEYCPILSGSMKMHIYKNDFKRQTRIVIRAPFYDLNLWRKTGKIRYTHEVINGKKHYAQTVNDVGAFGKPNKSTHWVNKVVYKCCWNFVDELEYEMEGNLEI